MATFGIIAEGITDQKVIENILLGYFAQDDDEPIVNFVQPPNDKTARSRTPAQGGWTLVFDHLRRGEHLNNLQFNDYLVIHIDTDVCDEIGFDVTRHENGVQLPPEELVVRVITRLRAFMGEETTARIGHRLLFAIAVHGIECWLMPLFYPNNAKSAKSVGCLQAANHELTTKNELRLSNADGTEKDPRAYERASRPYRKRAILLKMKDKNPSLNSFVTQLERVAPLPVA